LENKDYEIAFRMSHNLKGVSLNLGLTNLQKASQELCETVRHGEPATDISGLVTKVTEEYNKVVDAISKL
jgi:HPt (histidine-containing phosphotransfer) domain-containing protein